MLSKSKIVFCMFITILLHPVTSESLSFNQPKFCPNASWNSNGIIFSYANSRPYGLFVHASNMVYATEQDTNQVQVWSSQGGIAMVTISSYLNNPGAIFVSMNGDIYVDNGNNLQVERWASGAGNGIVVMNVTVQCMGLFIDINNTLYCAASEEHQVLAKSLNEGTYSMRVVAGANVSGSQTNQLCLPNGIFVDQNFNLYVADWCNSRIQKFKVGEQNGQTVAGQGASGTVDLYGPTAIVLDSDNYLFISDMLNNRIVGSGPNGFRCIVGCSQTTGTLTSQFNGPRGLGFDTYGNLFVADRENDRILKFILAVNSCDETITSTTSWASTSITNKKDSSTTSKQIHNGVDKTNPFVLHIILSLIIATFQASF